MLQIRAAPLADMLAHATRAAEEACGLLIGRRVPQWMIERCVAAQNVHPTPRNHFVIDAATLLQADAVARAVGSEIIGFYHSHPAGGSVPSAHDRRDAWPGFVMVIISVQPGARAYLSAWRVAQDKRVQPVPVAGARSERAAHILLPYEGHETARAGYDHC